MVVFGRQHTRRRRRPRRGAPPSRRCRPPPPQEAGSGSADAPAPSAALFCGAAAHDRRLPPLAAHENGRGGTCRCGPPGRRGLCRHSVKRQSRQRQRRSPQLPKPQSIASRGRRPAAERAAAEGRRDKAQATRRRCEQDHGNWCGGAPITAECYGTA
ncbi:hypothetical protein BU14_0317s0001 [Porphyra umbilicalis]|uniref:Uncharacterized protein n=1 Tax=Porphyra umbilicalis TaxID=2786 RepID=A0A1X6NZA1_PORUM|nr:hypothetical protein BU14_0317s0001 [Porphyra umbilicalis]|eukprot:OSX73941.1 hypothetical protein BU14_0317s0001 [Porphyra umbilicalis]